MKQYFALLGIAFGVIQTASANPLQDILQQKALNAVNKIDGNITTGSLSDTTVNATARAEGADAYAAAGAVINHNRKNGVMNNKQRGEVNLKGAQIEAHAEASAGKKAFAGAYVNK